MKNEIYLRDLVSRQNHSITTAQLHLLNSIKGYNDEDIKTCIKHLRGNMVKVQENLLGEKLEEKKEEKLESTEFGVRTRAIEDGDKRSDKRKSKSDNPEIINRDGLLAGTSFVYKNKLILIDNEGSYFKIKCKEDLFDNIIEEFKKMYDWMDRRDYVLRCSDESCNVIEINKEDVKSVMDFFDKLNRMQIDG